MLNNPPTIEYCPLCEREMEDEDKDRHHLIPKQKGGKKGPTVDIHRFCHTKIHSLFTNKELAKTFNTIEKLKETAEIQAFIAWVANKPSSFYMKNSESNVRKKGGRR